MNARGFFHLSDQTPVNKLWLVFFRCSVSALIVLNFASMQADFNDIFSANSYIPPDINNVLRSHLLPSIYGVYRSLSPTFHLSYPTVLLTFRIVYPVALLSLFAGLFTRISAGIALLLQLVILNSMDLYCYGFDAFTTIALFYCVIFPVGAEFSLDNYVFKRSAKAAGNNQFLWVLRAHICIIYFFSGFEKLLGYNWRNGESIWKMVHGYNVLSFIDLDFLYKTPIFFIAGWGTIIVEMFYPLFINIPKTRKAWLIVTISFHVMIAFFMGLYFFSAMMIIFSVTTYYIPFNMRVPQLSNTPGPIPNTKELELTNAA